MNRNIFWKGFIVLLVGLALISGVLIYFEGTKKEQRKQEISASPSPVIKDVSPTPTVLEEVDITKYKIQVLNGSGIQGEAAGAKELLEKDGFTVTNIGNADKSTYEETVIQAKKGTPIAFLDKLKSILEKTYTLKDDEDSLESNDFEAIVIIGKKNQ